MSNYEISKSSLLSLKAEIIRKQEEVKNSGLLRIKKKVPLIIKNKGIKKRRETDTVEDLDLLKKSRLALAIKAKLYEKLSNSKIIDDDPSRAENRYLVRFNDKNKDILTSTHKNESSEDEEDAQQDYDNPENSDEEWVEYVDSLGRTRKCLRKDLQYFKLRDKEYKRDELQEHTDNNKIIDAPNNSSENTDERQLQSDDMRREILRQQWEREEIELRDKDNIHYQDILFNEARSHGVGYYGFSKQEDVRRQQQISLEKLRKETEQEQKKYQELKLIRDQQLAARLKAARMRKRARLGLPMEEEEEEDSVVESEIGPPIPVAEKSEEDILKEKLLEEARRNHIRPWDVGKIKVGEFYEYTQEEWVEKKRNERVDEFAPPTTDRRDFRGAVPELKVSESVGSLRFSTKRTENNKHNFDNNGKSLHKHSNEELQDPFNEETRSFQPFTFTKKLSHKRKYEQLESHDEKSSLNMNTATENTELLSALDNDKETIAYASTSSVLGYETCVKNNSNQAFNEYNIETMKEEYKSSDMHNTNPSSYATEVIHQDIETSIEVGLRFLRKQAERKESVRDYENDDMFAM